MGVRLRETRLAEAIICLSFFFTPFVPSQRWLLINAPPQSDDGSWLYLTGTVATRGNSTAIKRCVLYNNNDKHLFFFFGLTRRPPLKFQCEARDSTVEIARQSHNQRGPSALQQVGAEVGDSATKRQGKRSTLRCLDMAFRSD